MVPGEDCVECPFHEWRFRGDTGRCQGVPYSEGKVREGDGIYKTTCSCTSCRFEDYYIEDFLFEVFLVFYFVLGV